MYKIIVGKCLLQQLLDQRRMTATDLSVLTGISKSHISEYIHNQTIMSLQTAARIAYALKCHIDDLYEWILEEM